MKLSDVIRNKIDALFQEYDKLCNNDYTSKIREYENGYRIASEYLDDLTKSINNIAQLETAEISKIVSESNWEMIDSQLKTIKLVLKAQVQGIVVDLNAEQKDFYNRFMVSLKEKVEELENYIKYYTNLANKVEDDATKIEEKIDELDELLQKIILPDNTDELTIDEFEIFYKTFVDREISNVAKKALLKEWINYNLQIRNSKSKTIEHTDIEAVKALFREFNVSESVISYIDKFKEEVSINANINKMREILEYLSSTDEVNRKYNIVNKFEGSGLLCIALYGSIEYIKNLYNSIVEENKFVGELFFKTPSLWINNISSSSRRGKKHSNGEQKSSKRISLYQYAHAISYVDIKENEAFLRNIGISASFNEGLNVKALKTPPRTLKDNYQILKNYGIINDNTLGNLAASILSFSNIEEHMDALIEVGLLDDPIATECGAVSYVVTYPSAIQNIKFEALMALNLTKRSMPIYEYYDKIFSTLKQGQLSSQVKKNMGYKLDTEEEKELFKLENFADLSTIPNYEEYLSCIYDTNLIGYEDYILEDPLIQELEQNYKVSDYSYQFGNQIISRYKVLRLFSSLRQFGYSDRNALLFAITYGSFISEEDLELIKSSIKLQGGQR